MGDVSVVIPARNAPQLHATLASLASPGNRDALAEILVIGPQGCCTGEHPPEVRFLPTESPATAPVARNIGIHAATGAWLAFIDADCIAAPDWLPVLRDVGGLGRPVVGGGVVFGRAGYWGDVHNVSMLHDYHVSTVAGRRPLLPTLNLLVRRDVTERVGLMNEALRRAQDLEWTARMASRGVELWFEPEAQVTHNPGRGAGSLWRDYFDTGRISYSVRAALGLRLPFPARLRSRLVLRLLSPAIATAAALRPYHSRAFLPYVGRLPGVWYTKLAWCLGASSVL